MIKEIVHDVLFLSRKAEPATPEDLPVGEDLLDTLKANRERCVGMAANMIGINKAVIIINRGETDTVLFNPVVISKSGLYTVEEGCLSLTGVRKAERYKKIVLEYRDINWKKKTLRLQGFEAQIAQHELDHLNGILI